MVSVLSVVFPTVTLVPMCIKIVEKSRIYVKLFAVRSMMF